MNFLPVVDPQISWPLAKELESRSDLEYIQKELGKMKSENPVLAGFLRDFAKFGTNDENGSLFTGVLIYKLLRSQAEADWMKQEIPL